jgi:hypothetical protein
MMVMTPHPSKNYHRGMGIIKFKGINVTPVTKNSQTTTQMLGIKEEKNVIPWTDPYMRQSRPEEQKLYKHLLDCVQVETPNQLIERFRCLFIDGVGYPDPEILVALDRVLASNLAEEQFKFVLNRCCHILINRWQMQSHCHTAIPQLVDLFENTPTNLGLYTSRVKSIKRLHQLVELFSKSEQYLTLRRLAVAIASPISYGSGMPQSQLGRLIRRYPYLYEHCLLSEDSSYQQQQVIRHMQANQQQQFETNLSQYVTYQVRRQLIKQPSRTKKTRVLQPVKNPTLLSDRELFGAISHYVGKVEGVNTYRDLAQSFVAHSRHTHSFRTFKGELYSYLVSSVDPEYGRRHFNNQLYTHLQNILPHNDAQPLSEFLLLRTCSHLLNYLVVDSRQRPQHFVLIDLVGNMGITVTIGLLLKIVLICQKVKPYLEKRFSILFNHYESSGTDGVMWLIKALENLNVALSIHFGSVDLSYIKQLR